MTMRLSISSLAGIARTLVAVGTARLAFMLVTVRGGRAAQPADFSALGWVRGRRQSGWRRGGGCLRAGGAARPGGSTARMEQYVI